MQRPIEYQNLIKTGALEEVVQIPGALALYLTNAQNYLADALVGILEEYIPEAYRLTGTAFVAQ